MRTNMQSGASDLFDQAAQTFDAAIQAGIHLQGETMRLWSGMLQEANPIQPMQHREQAMVSDMVPKTQNDVSQYLSLLSRSCQTGMDMLHRAFEPGAGLAYFGGPRHMQEFWRKSIDSIRTNARDMIQVHIRVVECWAEMASPNAAAEAQSARGSARTARSSTASKVKSHTPHASQRRSPAQW